MGHIETLDGMSELRNLDGYYFRVKRNDKWVSLCFSDLTDTEMDEILRQKRSLRWTRELCKGLAHTLRSVGDALDITVAAR